MPMRGYNEEELKEELVIPVYTKDIYSLEKNDGDECRYKTEEKTFKFSELLAIATKGSYLGHDIKRGGALIFVRDREEPYVSRDDYSVKKIIDILEKNHSACFSGLNQAGSPNIYAHDYKVKNQIMYLSNGAKLVLTKEATRKLKWISDVLTKGPKKSCFFETKKKTRERNGKKRKVIKM